MAQVLLTSIAPLTTRWMQRIVAVYQLPPHPRTLSHFDVWSLQEKDGKYQSFCLHSWQQMRDLGLDDCQGNGKSFTGSRRGPWLVVAFDVSRVTHFCLGVHCPRKEQRAHLTRWSSGADRSLERGRGAFRWRNSMRMAWLDCLVTSC